MKQSNTAVNAGADAILALLNGGVLRIYDGTEPATAATDITTQTLLAELTYGSPAFDPASGGSANAVAMTSDLSADASGTATWFRSLKSDGTTVVFQGSAGVSGTDLVLSSATITAGITVRVTSHTYTLPKS